MNSCGTPVPMAELATTHSHVHWPRNVADSPSPSRSAEQPLLTTAHYAPTGPPNPQEVRSFGFFRILSLGPGRKRENSRDRPDPPRRKPTALQLF